MTNNLSSLPPHPPKQNGWLLGLLVQDDFLWISLFQHALISHTVHSWDGFISSLPLLLFH